MLPTLTHSYLNDLGDERLKGLQVRGLALLNDGVPDVVVVDLEWTMRGGDQKWDIGTAKHVEQG